MYAARYDVRRKLFRRKKGTELRLGEFVRTFGSNGRLRGMRPKLPPNDGATQYL